MSNPWYSLYLKANTHDDAAQTVLNTWQALGWTAYDPFPGGAGTPMNLKRFIKQFALPSVTGVIRVVSEGELPREALAALSENHTFLYAWLRPDGGGWQAWRRGEGVQAASAFGPFIQALKGPDELDRALAGMIPVAALAQPSNLPANVQKLAQDRNVSSKQAEKLADRMSSSLFGKLGGGAAKEGAQAFLGGGIDWNAEPGRRLRAAAAVLDLPANWREPDYVQAKDGYQAARALARNPKAMLTAGERAALGAIPDAARLSAVFVGKP